MYQIGLIGSGAWGQNYIKTLQTFSQIQFQILNRNNWSQNLKQFQGIIIATPPDSHISIAQECLSQNIPVIIEKPLALSLQEAEKLSVYKSSIIVNHIHLFSSYYQHLKSQIKKIETINSYGQNYGPFRNYSALWDYAPHDLAMILDLTNQFPQKIKCISSQGNTFTIQLFFKNFNTLTVVSNISDKKYRKLEILADDRVLTYDDCNEPKLIGIDFPEFNKTPLKNLIEVFLKAIDGKEDSRIGLELSLKVIQILEECQRQIELY